MLISALVSVLVHAASKKQALSLQKGMLEEFLLFCRKTHL